MSEVYPKTVVICFGLFSLPLFLSVHFVFGEERAQEEEEERMLEARKGIFSSLSLCIWLRQPLCQKLKYFKNRLANSYMWLNIPMGGTTFY